MKLGRPKNHITGSYIAYCNDDNIEIYHLDKDGLLITVNGKIIPEIYVKQKNTSERTKDNGSEHGLYIRTQQQSQLIKDLNYKDIFKDIIEVPHFLVNDFETDKDFIIHE